MFYTRTCSAVTGNNIPVNTLLQNRTEAKLLGCKMLLWAFRNDFCWFSYLENGANNSIYSRKLWEGVSENLQYIRNSSQQELHQRTTSWLLCCMTFDIKKWLVTISSLTLIVGDVYFLFWAAYWSTNSSSFQGFQFCITLLQEFLVYKQVRMRWTEQTFPLFLNNLMLQFKKKMLPKKMSVGNT